MWHIVVVVAITALLSAVYLVTSDLLVYMELLRKLKRENRPLVDSRERRRESRF